MKVKDLIAKLHEADPEAVVLVSGYETINTNFVAEVNLVKSCRTEASKPAEMDGDRKLVKTGEPSIWIGWSGDYRTESQLIAITDPDEYKNG